MYLTAYNKKKYRCGFEVATVGSAEVAAVAAAVAALASTTTV